MLADGALQQEAGGRGPGEERVDLRREVRLVPAQDGSSGPLELRVDRRERLEGARAVDRLVGRQGQVSGRHVVQQVVQRDDAGQGRGEVGGAQITQAGVTGNRTPLMVRTAVTGPSETSSNQPSLLL